MSAKDKTRAAIILHDFAAHRHGREAYARFVGFRSQLANSLIRRGKQRQRLVI